MTSARWAPASPWALVDHEGLAQALGVDLVGRQQIDSGDLALLATGQDALDVAAARTRHQAEIEAADARRSGVEHGKAVPVLAHGAELVSKLARQRQNRGAVLAGERAHADDDQRVLGGLELLEEAMPAVDQLAEASRGPRPALDRWSSATGRC